MSTYTYSTDPCDWCGKPVKNNGFYHQDGYWVCSRECSAKLKKYEGRCVTCGTPIKKGPLWYTTSKGLACSERCRDRQLPESECAWCGLQVPYAKAFPSEDGLSIFCSFPCKSRSMETNVLVEEFERGQTTAWFGYSSDTAPIDTPSRSAERDAEVIAWPTDFDVSVTDPFVPKKAPKPAPETKTPLGERFANLDFDD